jgi:hypothetical protein
MSDSTRRLCTAFHGHRRLFSGPLVEVALAVKAATDRGSPEAILVFDDATGRVVDLDLRGGEAEIIERLSRAPLVVVGRYRPLPDDRSGPEQDETSETRGRGRPRLGVVSREVTLLPRHWEWLATQPGGASAALRRLVDDARRHGSSQQRRRAAREAAYQFMLAIAGDLPGCEEATRALFADDRPRLEKWIADWPGDIRMHALHLAFDAAGPDAE